ncbi:MAG TPA: hypothetical protein VMW67_03690 [Desulfobacteria bacterium]|nr:hypothetical protein [Desulfobacteria bacterium]
MVNREKVLFVLGLVLALTGAFLMWNGSILGERTIPAAITLGIVGISLIATSKFRLLK